MRQDRALSPAERFVRYLIEDDRETANAVWMNVDVDDEHEFVMELGGLCRRLVLLLDREHDALSALMGLNPSP